MVLVTITSSVGSLQIAFWPISICITSILFFNLPFALYYNSDRSRHRSISINNSSSVNSCRWRFSLVKHWFFHLFLSKSNIIGYKFSLVLRCRFQYFFSFDKLVTQTNTIVQLQTSDNLHTKCHSWEEYFIYLWSFE